ncbi:TPA: hypothetical protein ACGPGC_003373 [Enterobacter hormaechei]|uniref:hypothetical protein n=1 Tax=Enterobacter cloacae TaxID=550 RepID=UPI0024697047|nr:hypothetical protein [Enterobacter cloacae]WGL80932.1 hypothetical protein QFB83_15890 [Enterobacter cloacae]
MAKSQDIFMGSAIDVAIGTDLTNKSLNGIGFVTIPEISTFPEISSTRNTIKVSSFSRNEDRTLVGRRSYADTTIAINYLPGNVIHERLISIAEAGSRVQLRITYWMDFERNYGPSFLVNGFLSSDAIGGGDEAAVTRTFTFAIDKIMGKGILDMTSQSIDVVNPLVITQDFPSVLNMTTAENKRLEIEVSGGYEPYSYRWYKDGQLTNIGSTTTALDFTGSSEVPNSHVRKVVVTDAMGQSVTSSECTVTITQA